MQLSSGPIGQLNKEFKEVNVFGAGISGLLIGYYLKKQNYAVNIFEKNATIGGKIQSIPTSYGIVESAANAIYTSPEVLDLLDELNIKYITATEKLKKLIWTSDGPSSPMSIKVLFKIVFSIFKKIPAANELHKISMFDFFSPLCGDKFCDEVLSSALSGIYATDSRNIHFKSLFKSPIKAKTYFGFVRNLIKERKKKNHKAISITFPNGMTEFISALENELRDNIQLNSDQSLDTKINTIICTDAIEASELLANSNPPISAVLNSIPYTSIQSTTCFTKYPIPYLENSFGLLFPKTLGFNTLGILHNTAIFPERFQDNQINSYTFIANSSEDPLKSINKDFYKIMNEDFDKYLIKEFTHHWKRGIPLYNQKRFDTILSLRSKMIETKPGLVIFGNYVGGISIREMIQNVKEFAEC